MAQYPELYPMSDEDVEALYECIGVTPEELFELKQDYEQRNPNQN